MTCPSCEYNKQRAQLWRNEAYKLGGHPLDWEPELMVRPKPLTQEQIHNLYLHMSGKSEGLLEAGGTADFPVMFARAVEEMHGIGEKE